MESKLEFNNKFDQKHLLENIFTIITQKGLKIGELEKGSGLSVGYLSRLAKSEKAFPTVETVWRIARTLGVSVEWLIEGGTACPTSQTEYLNQFIQRLFDQTREGKLDWGRYTHWEINSMLEQGAAGDFPAMEESPEGRTFNTPHALSDMDPSACSLVTNHDRTRRIRAVTEPAAVVAIPGSCFFTDLSEESRLYLIPYAERTPVGADETGGVLCENVVWYELLSVNRADGTVLPVCGTRMSNEIIAPGIRKLYTELKVHENDVRINPGVRSLIDGFMERTAPIR